MPAPIPDRVCIQLRLNGQLHSKLKAIADEESRYLNAQIEYYLKLCVKDYEKTHGTIPLPEGGD